MPLAIQQIVLETCPKPIQTFKTIPETLYSLQAETVVFNTQKYYPAREVGSVASSAPLACSSGNPGARNHY